MTINCGKETLHTGWTNEIFSLEKNEKGFLLLPIMDASLDSEQHEVLMMEDSCPEEKAKKIKKEEEGDCE